MVCDVIIIGGGPIGMWAACVCSMLGLNAILIEGMEYVGGQCIGIYPKKPIFDIPGLPGVKAESLVYNLEQQLKQFNVEIVLGEKVVTIYKEKEKEKFVIKTNKNVWESRAIIMSIGLGALKPNKPTFSNIDELEALGLVHYYFDKTDIFKGKVCAILGGGDSAAEWCLNLASIAKVYLIHRREHMRVMPIIGEKLQKLIEQGRCVAHMGTNIFSVEPFSKGMKVNLCKGSQCSSIEIDYLIPCYGMSINEVCIENYLEKTENGRILVDSTTCASSDPFICSVGDACSYFNKNNLISVGFADASNAAYYLAKKLLNNGIPKGYSTSWFAKQG